MLYCFPAHVCIAEETLIAEGKAYLDQLKPVQASYDPSRCCMADTRKSILDQITNWALRPLDDGQPPYTNNIYWLYGMPGLGKTAVANSLCFRLHQQRRLGGSYFCRRDDPILSEPGHVLPTLIYRLACMWPPYGKLVVQEIRSDPQLNPYASSSVFFNKLLTRLERHPPYPYVLVIDALDECGSPMARRALLKVLCEACSAVNWLRVVIVSRPEQDIDAFFHMTSRPAPCLSRNLDQDDQSAEDIKLFAKNRMESIGETRGVPADWPSSDLISQLVHNSDRLFIYIETLYLLIKDVEDPSGLLGRLLAEPSKGGMSSLFNLYLTVLKSKPIQDTEGLRSTIGAILAVAPFRPLREQTIARLLGIDEHVVRNRIDMLKSLFYRDESLNGGIRVRHLTVLEFLKDSACPDEYRVDMDQANMQVGCSCLKTMIKELRFNVCGLETSLIRNMDVVDLENRIQKYISDGLQYACLHWASHLGSIYSGQMKPDAYSLIDELFEGIKPLFWMEILSLMRHISVGISTLRNVLIWTRVSIRPYIKMCLN
jgi:hypothetical protein